MGAIHYVQAGSFPISQFIAGILTRERACPCFISKEAPGGCTLAGIFDLSELPVYYSKHLHILTCFSEYFLREPGSLRERLDNLEAVTTGSEADDGS